MNGCSCFLSTELWMSLNKHAFVVMRKKMEGSLVVQEDPPNALPLQCVLKENNSSSIQWQDFGDKVAGVPNSRFLFLTVEYIQETVNTEIEINNYSPSISENERLSPFDSSFSSPERYSPLYNTLVIPANGQSQFANSVVVLPASRNDSQQFSIVVEQSQLKKQLMPENEGKSCESQESPKANDESNDAATPHQSALVRQMDCDQNSESLGEKLIISAAPSILQQESAVNSVQQKPDYLANRNSFFQGGIHKMMPSADFNSSCGETNENSSSSREAVLLNEAEGGENKSLIYPPKFVISSENLKQDELLLSDPDQNNDLLIKSEALMEVDSYNLPQGTYMSPGIEEQLHMNNIEKVDNEYLLADAMAFEDTDSSILQPNLEAFTSQTIDGNAMLYYDKTRLRQTKKHPAEHLGFDYWCEDCEFGVKCSEHEVKVISDKPVLPRARATLPKELLAINKLHEGTNEEGVFARKTIMRRVQFGPVEGKLMKDTNDSKPSDGDAVELLVEVETGQLLKLDVSDEHESNWMRFVRKAKTLKEQNLILTQQGKSLYFITTRMIPPRQELRVGYSPQYAEKRKLKVLEGHSWNCFECTARFSSSDELQKHLNFHESEKDFNERPKKKSRNSSLRGVANALARRRGNRIPSAVEKGSDGATENECWSCHKTFPRTYSLRRHLMLVHPEKDKENSGALKNPKEKCGKVSMTNTLFKKKPSNGTGSEWLCTHCNLTFDNPSVLNLHTLTHAAEDLESETVLGVPSELSSVYHEGEFLVENGDVQCPQCTQEFPSKRQLIDHVTTHGKVTLKKCCPNPSKPFKCDQCYKAFTSDIRLQKHSLVHGSDEAKPYQCEVCFKRFLNNSALSCHRKTHNEAKVFDCPLCKKEFDQIFGLKEHIKVHSIDGFFTCPHCSKGVAHSSVGIWWRRIPLTRFELALLDTRKAWASQNDFSGLSSVKVFDGYSMIRKHVRAFHSGLQHICKDCGKLCPTLDKLRMHSLKHSDHREFLCANCGKQFKRKDKLKEHTKRMHSAEREMKLMSLALRIPNTKGRRFTPKMSLLAYDRYIYKCRNCMVGFKRRGMLVNHLAKRHPDIVPDTVPELNLPILKTTRDYFCQYCDKVYKSSSKRKAHILKNHPGAELPMSNRQKGGVPHLPGLPNPTFSKTVGSIKTAPHGCKWCHKQYASKAKLLQHQRKKHMSLLPESQQVPRVTKNPNSPVGSKITDNSLAAVSIDQWRGNKNGQGVTANNKINAEGDAHIGQGIFTINGELTQDVDSGCKKTLKSLPENISCELLQQAMSELSQSLSEYRLPFSGTQENFLKMSSLKDASGEGIARDDNMGAGHISRTWPDLSPYPPR